MKILFSIASFLVAVLAWCLAVLDYSLARMSEVPRSYLVPGRTFFATYRTTRAFLMGEPMNLETFRIRDYPRHKFF